MSEFKVGDRVRLSRTVRGGDPQNHLDVASEGLTGTVYGSGIGHHSVAFEDGVRRSVPASTLEPAPIDWNAPLEAYHPDGRVVAVERADRWASGYNIKPHDDVDSGRNWSFLNDGHHHWSKWRIRNRRADDKWGAVIQVDHARPDWLRDDDERVYKLHDYPSGTDIHGRWQELSAGAVGWPTCDAIRLRADHPYYTVQQHNEQHGTSYCYWPGGESAPDDWDGGVVFVWDRSNDKRYEHRLRLANDRNPWRHAEGYLCIIGYRRRAEPVAPSVSPELVDRMVRLVRDLAGGKHAWASDVRDRAIAIVSDLPDEPVDPLVERAREIIADEFDAKGLTVVAEAYHSGKRDTSATMRAMLRALRESQ